MKMNRIQDARSFEPKTKVKDFGEVEERDRVTEKKKEKGGCVSISEARSSSKFHLGFQLPESFCCGFMEESGGLQC